MTDKTREDFEAWAKTAGWPHYATNCDGNRFCSSASWEPWQAATQQSAARIAALEAEVLALRKDAERLDWLIDGAGRRIAIDNALGEYRIVDPTVSLVVTDWYATKREAIDSAIEAERGEG